MSDIQSSTATLDHTDEYESWSTPDDFEWVDLQDMLVPEVEDAQLVSEELRRAVELRRDVLDIIEEPTNANYGNGARERVGGRLFANIDAARAPGLSSDRGDESQGLVRTPLLSHRKRGQRAPRAWENIAHGTESAYQHHCRQHENGPCRPCMDAHAKYARERARRAKES